MVFFSPAGRVSLVQITALRLEALQLADQGLYECRILLLDEPTDELQNGTWTELSVSGELIGIAFVCVCFFFFVCVYLFIYFLFMRKYLLDLYSLWLKEREFLCRAKSVIHI